MKRLGIGLINNLSLIRLYVLERNQFGNNNKEEAVAEISIEPVKAKRKFDGKEYVLTKINYTEEDAKEDEAWHKERGTEVRIVEDGIFWLLYTKIGS